MEAASKTGDGEALTIGAVLDAEHAELYGVTAPDIAGLDRVEQVQRANFEAGTAALCFSGGGVRSAAFCLGVAQGLAARGMLKRFQYLSSVSGGGYAGGMLTAWMYRAAEGAAEVERELGQRRPAPAPNADAENPVWWVRRYANYLSPRLGALSLDTWTLFTTYVRNLLLNWLVLLPLLAATVCLPFLAFSLMRWQHMPRSVDLFTWGLLVLALGLSLLRWRTYSTASVGVEKRRVRYHYAALLLLWSGALVVTCALYGHRGYAADKSVFWHNEIFIGAMLMVTSAALGILFIAADIVWRRRKRLQDHFGLFFAYVVASVLSGVMGYVWIGFYPLLEQTHELLEDGLLLTVLGAPALLALLAFPEVVFLGIAGSLSDDYDREWWARTAALLLRSCALWICAAGVILLGPTALRMLADETVAQAPALLGGAAATLGGLLTRFLFRAGPSNTEGDEPPAGVAPRLRALRDLALGAVCFALIVVIFAGLAYYVDGLRGRVMALAQWAQGLRRFGLDLGFLLERPVGDALLAVSLGAMALFLGWAIDVNRYSLHAMYRDRLIRTFLAASRWRRSIPASLGLVPEPGRAGWLERARRRARRKWAALRARGDRRALRARLRRIRQEQREAAMPLETKQFRDRVADHFTGFDRHDNPRFHWLLPSRRPGALVLGETQPDPRQPAFVKAPFLVVNCALNMVGAADIFVQERKAESFTFTPLHAGSGRGGYRGIAEYGGKDGVTLGTALTISGAAVSPNAGYRSTPSITFLMTLFNARLGWWLGNPGTAGAAGKRGPVQSLTPLIYEMLGMTHGEGSWVFLSDGGHFENLGIYEMVRRGCRYIVAVDASADPLRTFDDLGNAIRKIRVDLGVDIQQVESFAIGGRGLAEKGRYAAVFNVAYPWSREPGMLLYLKTATYLGNPLAAPLDVMEYGSRSPIFPHESTSDQFFKESQFESYRALGEHEIGAVMGSFAKHVPGLFTAAVLHIRGQRGDGIEK